MTSQQNPGEPGTGRAAERPGTAVEPTVPMEPMEPTVRMGGVPPAPEEATSATLLDPESWNSGLRPTVESAAQMDPDTTPMHPAADQPTAGLRRFGPGVPVPAQVSDGCAVSGQAAAVWHGTVRPEVPAPASDKRRRRNRALRGWLLPLAVLLAVLAYLAWQHFPAPVTVTGVTVHSDAAVWGCGSTARVVGTVRTSGGAGTVSYLWRRSDGTVSEELSQRVPKGSRQTDVVLLWTFSGHGSLTARATLEVLAPQQRSATGSFTYSCR